MLKEATEGLDDNGGVGRAGMLPMTGVSVGVPRAEADAPGSAMLGDWRGDCILSENWPRCLAIIGGSRGVDESAWRSIGSSAGNGSMISCGFDGLESALGRLSTFSSGWLSAGV